MPVVGSAVWVIMKVPEIEPSGTRWKIASDRSTAPLNVPLITRQIGHVDRTVAWCVDDHVEGAAHRPLAGPRRHVIRPGRNDSAAFEPRDRDQQFLRAQWRPVGRKPLERRSGVSKDHPVLLVERDSFADLVQRDPCGAGELGFISAIPGVIGGWEDQ